MALRVAWFGHAGGRRADGLTAYSDQTVAGLVAAGCEVRFFHHDQDGDRTPVADAVALEGVRFKTVTLPAPRTLARIERALEEFRPDVVHCSVSVSLLDGAIARVARGLGAASVVTCHLPYAPAQSARGRVMRGLYRYHSTRSRSTTAVIALSAEQRDLLVHTGLSPGADRGHAQCRRHPADLPRALRAARGAGRGPGRVLSRPARPGEAGGGAHQVVPRPRLAPRPPPAHRRWWQPGPQAAAGGRRGVAGAVTGRGEQ